MNLPNCGCGSECDFLGSGFIVCLRFSKGIMTKIGEKLKLQNNTAKPSILKGIQQSINDFQLMANLIFTLLPLNYPPVLF